MADDPNIPNSDLEKHLTAGGALTTLLTGLAAPFATNYKYFGYTLFAVSSILLLIIAAIRLNKSLSKRQHILPLVVGLVVLCVIVLGLDGWSLRHPPPSTPPATPIVQSSAPLTVHNSVNTTNDKNSPIATGDGATVIVNDDGQHARSRPKVHTRGH